MKIYSIVYCFLDKNGVIEQDENGDIIYTSVVNAQNEKNAILVLKMQEKFVSEPEILRIKEITNGSN